MPQQALIFISRKHYQRPVPVTGKLESVHLQAQLEQGQRAACKVAHHLRHIAASQEAPVQRAELRSEMHMGHPCARGPR